MDTTAGPHSPEETEHILDAPASEEAAPTELELFLVQMLHQSGEVSGELMRSVSPQVPDAEEADGAVTRPLTAAEERLLCERDAIQRVLYDIRHQSSQGKLVRPERWERQGLTPAHMSSDDFCAFVLDSISAAQDGQPFESSGADADMLDRTPAPQKESGESSGVDALADSSLGDPEFLTPEDPGLGLADDRADTPEDDISYPTAKDAVPAANTTCWSDHLDGAVGQDTHAQGGLGADREKESPIEGDQELLEPGVLAGAHEPLAADDIVIMHRPSDVYLYSSTRMSGNYAKWSLQAHEGDHVRTLVENVRDECRIYPRPLLATSLCNAPFNLTEEQIHTAFKQAREIPENRDIKQVEASNGEIYYYSSQLMRRVQAQALAEYYSVERYYSV